MSNYLVDGADLTSVADAIRTKGGTSGQLQFPQGFVDAVEAIETGGGDFASGATIVGFTLEGASLPNADTVVDLSGKSWKPIQGWMKAYAVNEDTTLTIRAKKMTGTTPAPQCSSTAKIRTLIFDMEEPPIAGSQFMYYNSIRRVLGTPVKLPDLGGTGAYSKLCSTNLIEIYFVPNCAVTGGKVNVSQNFNDASLVSLANALKGGLTTAQTITIVNTTTKAKCSTIMGTVSQVTEGETTYDFFTQDDAGDTTLADFITNVKGWTIA